MVDSIFIQKLQTADVPLPLIETDLHESFETLFGVECGKKKEKHKRQESALVRHASQFQNVTDVVEFGCGVAGFSAHFCLANPGRKFRFHLLDRQSFRSNVRQDKVIRSCGNSVNRITKDVLDFGIDELIDGPHDAKCFLFATKHFCGFATDVLLNRYQQMNERGIPVRLCIAPCCHGLIKFGFLLLFVCCIFFYCYSCSCVLVLVLVCLFWA